MSIDEGKARAIAEVDKIYKACKHGRVSSEKLLEFLTPKPNKPELEQRVVSLIEVVSKLCNMGHKEKARADHAEGKNPAPQGPDEAVQNSFSAEKVSLATSSPPKALETVCPAIQERIPGGCRKLAANNPCDKEHPELCEEVECFPKRRPGCSKWHTTVPISKIRAKLEMEKAARKELSRKKLEDSKAEKERFKEFLKFQKKASSKPLPQGNGKGRKKPDPPQPGGKNKGGKPLKDFGLPENLVGHQAWAKAQNQAPRGPTPPKAPKLYSEALKSGRDRKELQKPALRGRKPDVANLTMVMNYLAGFVPLLQKAGLA